MHELQGAFGAALLGPGTSPDFPRGLAVYRANVFGNWSKALAGAYPVVRKIVGNEFFDGLAREYARAEPSHRGDLNAFGERLADFVACFGPAQDLPYLPDVARMEWLAHQAYYAADAAPFDPVRLSRMPQSAFADLRPVLSPASALMQSPWPLARLWEVHQRGYDGRLDVDLQAGAARILVHRLRWRVQVRALGDGDFRFLCGARDGERLGDALAGAMKTDPRFDPSDALARWVEHGAIADLR